MSNVHISIARIPDDARGFSIPDSDPQGTPEVIVSSGVSQALVSLEVTVTRGMVWRVAVGGTDDVYLAFGSAPTASVTGWLCPAGGTYVFRCEDVGDKAAVINA